MTENDVQAVDAVVIFGLAHKLVGALKVEENATNVEKLYALIETAWGVVALDGSKEMADLLCEAFLEIGNQWLNGAHERFSGGLH